MAVVFFCGRWLRLLGLRAGQPWAAALALLRLRFRRGRSALRQAPIVQTVLRRCRGRSPARRADASRTHPFYVSARGRGGLVAAQRFV